jgi:hypothetical protein
MYERPFDDVRKELNIIPTKEGPSWYQYPMIKEGVFAKFFWDDHNFFDTD